MINNKKLQIEDIIWIIYIFIAIFGIISNYYENKYNLTNNKIYRKKYKTINIIIFTIAFFIYLYFLYLNYSNINDLKKDITKKISFENHVRFIAAIFFVIGGILYLLTEINSYNDNDIAII